MESLKAVWLCLSINLASTLSVLSFNAISIIMDIYNAYLVEIEHVSLDFYHGFYDILCYKKYRINITFWSILDFVVLLP